MKHTVVWSKDAGDELIAAKNSFSKIIDNVDEASENAEGRRIAPLLLELGITDIHQINVNPWILFYKVAGNTMKIISIIDGRRNLEEILYKKIMDGKIL